MGIKVDKVIEHFENLYKDGSIYLWGANCQIITEQLCNKLYINFKSNTYNKKYYEDKFKEGDGKIGADCSGAFFQVSGFDTTAQGYYNKCIEKGNISSIPKDKPCLVFKGKSNEKITHIGFYCGNGQVIEMKSSKENCVKDQLDGKGWRWYGVPNWIDYSDYVSAIKQEVKTNSYLAKTTSDLNLRSSTSSKNNTNIIAVIPKGSFVYVEKHIMGVWMKVNVIINHTSYNGYASNDYLEKINIDQNEQRRVTSGGLNVRSGKGTVYSKLFTMNKNDKFTVITSGKWGLILYNNKLGYANITDSYSTRT